MDLRIELTQAFLNNAVVSIEALKIITDFVENTLCSKYESEDEDAAWTSYKTKLGISEE